MTRRISWATFFLFICTATTALSVHATPVANPGTFDTDEDTSRSIDLLTSELAWTDTGGEWSVTAIPKPPAHGTVKFEGHVVVYTPASNYFGTDSFEYQVSDATGAAAAATITMNVLPMNDPPQLIIPHLTRFVPLLPVGVEGGAIMIDLASNISDPDGAADYHYVSPEAPDVGDVGGGEGTQIYYYREPGFTGSVTINYTVYDSGEESVSGTLTLQIGDPNVVPAVQALNIDYSAAAASVARINDTVVVHVRVTDETGAPIPPETASVSWTITDTTAPETTVNVTTDNAIGADGIATASFTSDAMPKTYRVDVDVMMFDESASASATFNVTTGLQALARPDTPEGAMAEYLDWVCPRLQEAGSTLPQEDQELLSRCNEIMNAATSGADAQILNALRALAPEEAAAQARTGNSFGQTQLGNIGGRLAALRGGARGFALSGLAFNIKGERVPGSVLASLFERDARGGGASADAKLAAPRWSGFVSGNVGSGEKDRTDNEEGFDFQTRGLTAGADYRVSNELVFGAALGYARSEVDLSSRGGNLDASGVNIALYGTWYRTHGVYFDTVLNYASNRYDQKRNISYTVGSTTVNETARAKPDGRLFAVSLGGGYEHAFRNGASVEGSLRLRYLDTTIDSYTETGAGALNLAIAEQNTHLFTSSLGGRASWPVSFKWGVLIPQFDLSWEHDFDGGAHQIKGSFAADQFQNQFVFETDDEDRDYFTSGLGVSAVMPGGTTAFVQYQTTLGKDHFRDWNVALGGRIEFN